MLDFLLNNWLFTLIILWFLFGLFGQGNRQKARQEQHKHPAASKRKQEWHKHRETHRTQTDREETKRKLSDEAKRMARELQTRLEEVQQTWEEQQEVFAESIEELQEDAASPYTREDENPYRRENLDSYERKDEKPYERPVQQPYRVRNKAVNLLPTDRDSLKQGIIWAEVLGKPRAKRPYRPPYSRLH